MGEEDGSKSSLTSDSRNRDKRLFVHDTLATKKLFFMLRFVCLFNLQSSNITYNLPPLWQNNFLENCFRIKSVFFVRFVFVFDAFQIRLGTFYPFSYKQYMSFQDKLKCCIIISAAVTSLGAFYIFYYLRYDSSAQAQLPSFVTHIAHRERLAFHAQFHTVSQCESTLPTCIL